MLRDSLSASGQSGGRLRSKSQTGFNEVRDLYVLLKHLGFNHQKNCLSRSFKARHNTSEQVFNLPGMLQRESSPSFHAEGFRSAGMG